MWYFTPTERRGLTIWALCLIAICVSPYFIPETVDEQLLLSIIESHSISIDSIESLSSKEQIKQPKNYDPNTISAAQLKDKGLPKYIAERWVKFRSAKGGFQNENDILSIFGIDSSWVELEKENWIWDTQQMPIKKTTVGGNTSKTKTKKKSKKAKGLSSSTANNPIDINTARPIDFKALGFKEGIAHRIVAYREKAGPFYHYRDLFDIYEMDTQLVQRLIPLIQIETDQLPFLDINEATQQDWEKLPGIGPVFAGRIIKFREALGGFINKSQLKEVYGLPEETWIRMSPRIKLKSIKIQKIKVNAADIEDFARHPYIDWTLAKRFYRYKEQHYPISNLDSMHGLNQEKMNQLVPYFDFSIEKKPASESAQLNPNDSI